MVRKIISGGQTGADRAALDIAIQRQIPHGGWVPKGRRAEDGQIPVKYSLKETQTANYPERTEKNVQEADATLIVSQGPLTGGSLLTMGLNRKHGKPCLHLDLLEMSVSEASKNLHDWLIINCIEVLNVAGPRATSDSKIYSLTCSLLNGAMDLMGHKDDIDASSATIWAR